MIREVAGLHLKMAMLFLIRFLATTVWEVLGDLIWIRRFQTLMCTWRFDLNRILFEPKIPNF